MTEGMRILLVDDEKRILGIYSGMLEDSGYYVKTSATPENALRLVSEEAFDIVFLDQFLGAATGLGLMKQMAVINPELYFVIITANGSADLAVESLKKGASDFITKPFFIADMIKSIEYVNKKRELDRQKKDLLLTLESKVNEKTEDIRMMHFSVLSSLAQAMEKRDLGTYGHCKRDLHYCDMLACSLSLEDSDKHYLGIAAMLHDIGKIGISDFILGKPQSLTGEEKHDIRSHPVKGVEILKPLKYLEPALPAILHHHENYDGSGYPHGLAGENIPLLARIIAVADTYDAILSNRPYRSAADHNKAVTELLRCAGKQFDTVIVNIFVGLDITDTAEQGNSLPHHPDRERQSI